MNRLTFPASIFSAACQRCGSTLRKNAESCPNCGADREAAFGESPGAFKAAGGSALASIGAAAHPGGTSVASAAQPWNAKTLDYSAIPEKGDVLPDDGIDSSTERWTHGKTAIVGAVALALLSGVAVYLQRGSGTDDSTQHSASGAIDLRAGSAGGSGGAALPAVDPAGPLHQAEAAVMAAIRPSTSRGGIQAVRDAMLAHDLGAARAQLRALTPQQQNSEELAGVADELAQLEVERDTALKLARACEKSSAWPCVQQNAGEALALDGSNLESQALLERVIAHSGWSTNAASAGNRPAGVAAGNAPAANPATPAPRRRLWAGQTRNAAAKQAADEDVALDTPRDNSYGAAREATQEITRQATRDLSAAPVDAHAATIVTVPQPVQTPTQTQTAAPLTAQTPQPARQATATTVAAPGQADLQPAAVATHATADTRSDPRPAHALTTEAVNADDLERAIKQYGWSGDNSANKAPR